jgi:hypothetical protein
VTVAASDNVGVRRVEVYVGGVLTTTRTTGSFTFTWTPPVGTAGSQLVVVNAYDAAGNLGYAMILVPVQR